MPDFVPGDLLRPRCVLFSNRGGATVSLPPLVPGSLWLQSWSLCPRAGTSPSSAARHDAIPWGEAGERRHPPNVSTCKLLSRNSAVP